MKLNARVAAEMRLYQRYFQAGVLFCHLPGNRERAAESVIAFMRFCEDEGLTKAGLLEGVPAPRSHAASINAHALLSLLPETNKLEAVAVVARFLRYCDEAELLPAVVGERRRRNLTTFPVRGGGTVVRFPSPSRGNSPRRRAISTERPEIEPK
jgi:hypothetical protein